jgi:ethanolamine utilization protein EutN
MLQGIVIGHATSTIKHPSLTGWRLAIVQPVGPDGKPDGDPNVAVDPLGAGAGQRVVINSDGKGSRQLIGDDKTPARYFVIALVDE